MFILGINAYHGDVSAVLAARRRDRRRGRGGALPPDQARRGVSARSDPRVSRDGRHHGPRHRPRRGLARPAREPRPQGLVRGHGAADRRVCSGTARTTTGRSARFRKRSPRRSISRPDAPRPKIHWVEHHPAHLASTFFVSPFDDAAVCAIDGFGDFVSTSWAIGRGTRIDIIDRTFFPHSLGMRVPGDDAVPRLHEVRRRVQGHGPRAVRRARLHRRSQPARAPAPGRPFRARPVVLQALDGRLRHDVDRRRAAARPGVQREARDAARARRASRASRSRSGTKRSPRRSSACSKKPCSTF